MPHAGDPLSVLEFPLPLPEGDLDCLRSVMSVIEPYVPMRRPSRSWSRLAVTSTQR